jgi:hypothetical protein
MTPLRLLPLSNSMTTPISWPCRAARAMVAMPALLSALTRIFTRAARAARRSAFASPTMG